jgi:hypothetical protein
MSSTSHNNHHHQHDNDKNNTDEQLARDMQLAFELQDKEEEQSATAAAIAAAGGGTASNYNWNVKYMLFVSCTLDHAHDVTLLVDTGASSSAMSLDMATNLGLLSKLNRNVYGSAMGVGSSNIVGILENIEVVFHGHVEFRLCFMVLDSPTLPCCILGLDQMRKYKCQIDLDGKELVFGGKGGVSVPFLPPSQARQVAQQMMIATQIVPITTRQQEQEEAHRNTLGGILHSFFRF